jgi:hypothetical protein
VGRHSTEKLDDGYMGSGKWPFLCQQSGIALDREILEFYDSVEEVKKAEGKLLDEHFGKPECMNFSNVPAGWPTGDANPARTPEERKKRSENAWMKTEEGRRFLSENNFSKTEAGRKSRRKTQIQNWLDPDYRANLTGENHWTVGNEEFSKRMRENNPMFNPEVVEKVSKKTSETIKKLHAEGKYRHLKPMLRENWLGDKNPMRNPEISQKLKKPKPKVECPHCGKIGGLPVMRRYHFDECKNRGASRRQDGALLYETGRGINKL